MNYHPQRTVLITGSSGFTSSYLREALLSAGYIVWGMVNKSPRDWEICADLMNLEALRKMVTQISPDYVIHLAGISNVIHENTDALYQVNCQGTLNLLSVLQKEQIPVKKIILASSAYVYGNANTHNNGQTLITEKTCPKPINHYAMSKLAMEYMATSLYENLPIVVVRPFNYTGAGQRTHVLVPKIVHHFLTRTQTIHLGNMYVYREFNDVRMVAKAYLALLTSAEPGVTVNLCTGNSYCLHEILALSEKISGHHLEVIVDQNFVRKNEAAVLSGDPTLLKSIVPNLPSYTLEDTLRWMFEQSTKYY